MALTPKQVRQRIATALEAVSGWHESKNIFTRFPVLDSNQETHLSFSVSIDNTINYGTTRQRRSEEHPVETSITVQITYVVRPQDQIASLDDALDVETTLIQTVKEVSQNDLHIIYQNSNRTTDSAGKVIIVSASFRALHNINLYS